MISIEEAQRIVATKTAPKITKESIEERIAKVEYLSHGTTTICIITMCNGFKFIGHSTPASPENFDASVGERYAYDNAFKQIWTHEAYLLVDELSRLPFRR
jgi:hypothetical protein